MIASTINLTIFIMMIIIYLNEMRNISMFIFNFNYIKDLSKIVMEQKCNNIYCEAETDRYQIAKNSYNLLMPNDVFNSKTYTIFVFIISILVFIYYHYILFDKQGGGNKPYYVLNIFLLIILLTIIIYRYVPNDDAGYLNYFKDTPQLLRIIIGVSLILIAGSILITYVNTDRKNYNTYICYVISIIVLLNLMNIVMTFRSNTKPMLKTKSLLWSIKKSIDNYVNNSDMSIDKLTYIGDDLKEEIKYLKELTTGDKYNKTTKQTIAYYMKILIAFKELSKIYSKSLSNDTGSVADYIKKLKKDIKENYENIIKSNEDTTEADADISELSLIFDKEINLPITYYGDDGDEHITNANTANAEYVYTADISYDNPNLFYEKYWDMNEIGNNRFIIIPQFLYRYDYFTPTFLFGGLRPNLFKILMLIILSIVVLLFIDFVLKSFAIIQDSEIFKNILPLFMLAILILFIISFISFNTWFNKYVVYKCLDSSYKRSLNKLNNITTPYIRLYDNKIVNGNKNYLRNYIITNVFYSLLNGNIKLNDDAKINKVYEAIQATTETQTMMRQMIKLIIGLSEHHKKTEPEKTAKLAENNANRATTKQNIIDLTTTGKFLDKIKTSITEIVDAAIDADKTKITGSIDNIIAKLTISTPSVKSNIDLATPTQEKDKEALELAKKVETDISKILTDIEELKTKLLKTADTPSEAINSKDDYYNITKIKSSRLQFTNINGGNLSDENGFRDYYKGTFKDIYDKKYNPANADKLYKVFGGLFADPAPSQPTDTTGIDTYFKTTIINESNVKQIYYIIKKCFNLFDESKFNSNLAYYNDAENKHKGINISSYNKFSFYKYNNKIIPYKFVLKLNSTSERDDFTKDLRQDEKDEFDVIVNELEFPKDTTKILDNNDEDLLNQASDIEKNQNKNLIKIIAKYLLILGHINYNRIEYVSKTSTEQKEIYEKKTYNLYKLISDTLYNDTYDIDDTFKTTSGAAKALFITDQRYKNLTYIYNYLETKYVSISSNNNNSNYLMNIIKSINNKINDDDKTFKNVSKDSKYLFRDYIDRKDNKEDYENEEEILTIANNISTTTLGGTYIFNIILLIIVVNILKIY